MLRPSPLFLCLTMLFATGARAASMPWSSFAGGSGVDAIQAVAIDQGGDAILVGYSASEDYPVSAGAYQTTKQAGNDVVVTKLGADGSLVWSTYLGGGASDIGRAVAVDRDGNVYVTGETMSTDFPVTPGAFRTVTGAAGTYDAFVAKISSDGRTLLYSTYLGGTSSDYGRAIAVDGSGQVTVGGYTGSVNFPTTPNVVKPTRNPSMFDASDGFVTKLNDAGSAPIYSTYVGSDAGTDLINELALDANGSATVAGWTASSGFPTTSGAFDRTFGGVKDGFAARLAPNGGSYVFSTFVGGAALDESHGLAVDGSGNTVVVGMTASTDLPTTPGAFQTAWGGGSSYDGFVWKISPTGGAVFGSYLGGSGSDASYGVALAGDGSICVTGACTSTNFPVTADGFSLGYTGGAADSYLSAITPDGSRLLYSSYVGSSGNDQGQAITIGPDGKVAVVGSTDGANFPTTPGAPDRVLGGTGGDGFASTFDIGLGGAATGVGGPEPRALEMTGPWPNPFRAEAVVSLALQRPERVLVRVLDVSGRIVQVLADQEFGAGDHRWSWNGRDARGGGVQAGCYFVEVRTPRGRWSKPVTFLK